MMGSKNHKKHYSFRNFVETRGGIADEPITEDETTSFTFKIDRVHFAEALKRYLLVVLESVPTS